jgi:guanylate kinase
MKQENFILVISSPSGAGKTSLAKEILKQDQKFVSSISVTTRAKRPGEIDGQDYYFVTKEKFNELKSSDELLEDVTVFGNYYGSPKKHILDKISLGYDILFDIDWQGAQILKEKLGHLVTSIFILPPSLEELERRLRTRGQDTEEVIQHRMSQAVNEINHYDVYDYVLINKNFDKTMSRISTIIAAERLRNFNYTDFVNDVISTKKI